jgi:hypothetical protein
MKTKKQITEQLDKFMELYTYYLSHMPKAADELPKAFQGVVDKMIPSAMVETELIMKRQAIEEKYNINTPKNVPEISMHCARQQLICQVLNWVLDLKNSAVGMLDPDSEPPTI